MDENQVRKSVIIVSIAVLLACMTAVVGLDNLMEPYLIFVLWAIVGFCATAVGHLVSLLVNLVTGKDHLRLFLPVCSGILLLITLIWVEKESHGFMGNLGAGIIFGLFSLPVGAVFVFWSAAGIISGLKQKK